MKRTNFFENNNDEYFIKNIKGQRGSKLTIDHLLKLRNIREKKKLNRLKDLKLYNIMYNDSDGENSGF